MHLCYVYLYDEQKRLSCDVSEQTPTMQLTVDLMLINVYLQGPNKDPGGNVALDFSRVTSLVAMTYCGKSVTINPTAC